MSREEDAKMAELVMAGVRLPVIFEPTSKVYDDYEVLKHVRETWTYTQFDDFLLELRLQQAARMRAFMRSRKWNMYPDGNRSEALYEPGDYSLAALKVKEAE